MKSNASIMSKEKCINKIIDVVCKNFECSKEDLCSSCRKRCLVEARVIAQVIATEEGVPPKEIQRQLNRKHPFQSNAKKNHATWMRVDKNYRRKFYEIANEYQVN